MKGDVREGLREEPPGSTFQWSLVVLLTAQEASDLAAQARYADRTASYHARCILTDAIGYANQL